MTGTEFLGPVCRLSLEAGPLRLLAAVSPQELAALNAVPGADVAATLPADRIMVFAEDA